jgi:hypothetical protein
MLTEKKEKRKRSLTKMGESFAEKNRSGEILREMLSAIL